MTISSLVFALVLVSVGLGLIGWHVAAWRRTRAAETDPAELDFRRRQLQRRVQTSAMIALLGAAVAAGDLIAPGVVLALYWGGVLLGALWIALLALADVIASQHHFGKQQARSQLEAIKLQAQLHKLAGRSPEAGARDDRRP